MLKLNCTAVSQSELSNFSRYIIIIIIIGITFCRLMEQSEENRMTAQNLAIVWGPNLMWPRHDAGDIAVNMVHQNQIIEFLLLEFEQVFK